VSNGAKGMNSGLEFAAVAAGTVLSYTIFTFAVTKWRTSFRKEMNDSEFDATSRLVDSLINFETVKVRSSEALRLQ